MSNDISLDSAILRVEQVQAILGMFLQIRTDSEQDSQIIGALLNLLDGVPKAMTHADEALFAQGKGTEYA